VQIELLRCSRTVHHPIPGRDKPRRLINQKSPCEGQAQSTRGESYNEIIFAQMPNLIKGAWLVRIAARATP